MYRKDMSDEALLGGIGYIVGHEISHGFDYLGSQTDAYGQPDPVFSDATLDSFLAKCDALIAYYDTIEYATGSYADGGNVIGEAMADLSGLQTCLALAAKSEDTDYDALFRQAALTYATVTSEFALISVYAADTHPLNYLRTNVNIQMFDAIYGQLGVSEGDGMYLPPASRVAVWGPRSAMTAEPQQAA